MDVIFAFLDASVFLPARLLIAESPHIGAVCGQFAGAYWGKAGIPADWLDGLVRLDIIEQMLGGLL